MTFLVVALTIVFNPMAAELKTKFHLLKYLNESLKK